MLVVMPHRDKILGDTTDRCSYAVAAFSDDPFTKPAKTECLGDERPIQVAAANPPAVRAAMSGQTSYVLMYRPVMHNGLNNDVVVYRKDDTTFNALKDGGDGDSATGSAADCQHHDKQAGRRVRMCRQYPANAGPDSLFGQERHIGTELTIAAHPSNAKKVFIMWGEKSPSDPNHLKLALIGSDDAGETWSDSTLWTVDHATNPAVAVASDGAVGVLYEKLVSDAGKKYWNTEIAISENGFANVLTHPPLIHVLAHVLATSPPRHVEPYLGDYIHLDAVGRNFYGVFPASNDRSRGGEFPDLCPPSTCPGQRPYNSQGHPVSRKQAPVPYSIDPYFFRVTR